jgi:cobalt-zinc-cadmium efflux system protein
LAGARAAIGIALNGFVIVEASAGVINDSVAFSPAGRNLSDVWPRGRWVGTSLAKPLRPRAGSAGFQRLDPGRAFQRRDPHGRGGGIAWGGAPPRAGRQAMVIAVAAGIVINAATLLPGPPVGLNIRSAFLRMVADAAISASVVLAALLIIWTGWWWSSCRGLLISVMIVIGTWALLHGQPP